MATPSIECSAGVKTRQLAVLRAPRTVVVDFDTGRLDGYRAEQTITIRPDIQWVVPNVIWLKRLKRAMVSYNQVLVRHAFERGEAQQSILKLLKESRTLAEVKSAIPAIEGGADGQA
jgi:hypothetical protein